MKKKALFFRDLFLSVLLILFLYILIHETGHLIVMLCAGAKITSFSILTAHVSGEGGNYTDTSDLWLHANGAFLPVLVSYVWMLFYRKDIRNSFYRIFSWFVCLVPASSLLAWVFIPFLWMKGNAPVNDDVTNFLFNFSQSHHPLLVSLGAIVLIAVSVVLAVRKQVVKNMFETVRSVRESAS